MQIQKKVEMLIEQTVFLLDQQKDALRSTEEIFSKFIKQVQTKSQQKGLSADDTTSLSNITKMLADKLSTITEEMLADVEFLEKQLEALNAIAATKDASKAQTMIDMIFDKDEELLTTAEFKETILEDAEIAKEDLVAVMGDLTEALNENNIRDVELLLETMGSEGEIEIDFEDDGEDDEDECGSCEDSCCQSSKKNENTFKGCCQSNNEKESCCGSNKKSRK
ncbi:MAG: hypothetical protein US49_C0001G0147 [candidate division TM6 bacterium GW2011_GWF2_37_49]|nr:MAG: hypothetical protein US49_C0001G0147 [candidate division TM6 bacterium GW2011_GWF2_37_49]